MKYLFDHWEQIKKELHHKYILFLFDFDGTLTPITKTPQQAVLGEGTRTLLKKLTLYPDCTLAIVSGRSLEDIEGKVGLKNIIYVGNHGLEIQGPQISFESPVSVSSKAAIRQIYDEMAAKLASLPGALVEDKGVAVSVHYRLVDSCKMRDFLSIFSEVTEPYLAHRKIKITEGKRVYEIKPVLPWDKGKIALWLLMRQQFLIKDKKVLPVYFGDDLADEEAFGALKNRGLTVFVGETKSSKAAYFVRNPEETAGFIKQFLEQG